LMTFDVAQCRPRVEGGKSIEDLHLHVRFGKEGSAWDRVSELQRGLEPFQETLTVWIRGEEESWVAGYVEPSKVENETEDSEQAVAFYSEQLGVRAFSKTTALGKDTAFTISRAAVSGEVQLLFGSEAMQEESPIWNNDVGQ
jgi:hypothetical protein